MLETRFQSCLFFIFLIDLQVSVRKGSPLEKSHLKLGEFLQIAFAWASDMPNLQAQNYTGLSNKTVVSW